ncbi:MAG: glycosyltransferase [Cephaloticoccus sp.]|nr:glycosyltransferase [Cephaloticoccus sp.]MCF7760724.1 glycosyltransferase [Cephaloticoccus sp.]
MHLLDLSHTSHTRAQTGIQKVARALYHELTGHDQAHAITWDHYADTWRELAPWELANLLATSPGKTRGARWPWPERVRSRWNRRGYASTLLPPSDGLIVPELFSPAVARALPRLAARSPKVAIFHDAIALKLPELSPGGTVSRFPSYLQELLQFDGIAAVSDDSRQTLLDYWAWLGVPNPPPVQTIPLGLDAASQTDVSPMGAVPPSILCVGSIEGRKNHIALLGAAEQLWNQGRRFNLRLIGMANTHTGKPAMQKIAALQQAGRPLRYDGPVDEVTLESAYAECTFTVYPSLMEGFGLPVLESLSRGKPCICSAQGALGESARAGGALTLAEMNLPSLADAMEQLVLNPSLLRQLGTAARARTYRSWSVYTGDLLDWMKTLP